MANAFDPVLMHWEDVVTGESVSFGAVTVTRDQIIEFARAFDPQPFHLDDEAARHSIVGHLFASGWHSCALMMRMLADEVLNKSASLGSPGMEEVKWLKPVLPDDRLSGRYTCLSKRRLASRPKVGVCQMLIEMVNQNGDVVMTWKSSQFLSVRSPEAAS
jgi:acyl dehydratase